jgi:osmotically-inducible protein OsmY
METTASTPTRNDNTIREDVLSELTSDPKITSTDIAVAAKDGVVTLSGFVSDPETIFHAEGSATPELEAFDNPES